MNPEDYPQGSSVKHPDAFGGDANKGLPPEPVNLKTSAPTPMMPRRPQHRTHALRRIVVFLLLMVIVGAIAYAVYIVGIVAKISTNSWQLSGLTADASGRTNILVLGVGDAGHAGENLSDTMMLLSLDGRTNRTAQVSIPRDLRVNISGYGYTKINAANARGGVTLAEQTVSDTLGVPVDYYLKTNFSGLKDLVDAVGGIDVDVKKALIDREYPCDDNQYKVCGLNIPAGQQHMNGTTALQYVRCRKGTCGDDFGRAARQQEVISLLRPKLTDWHLLLSPTALTKVAEAAQKGVATDMGLIQLLELAKTWQSGAANKPVQLVLSTAPGGYLRSDPAGTSDLLPIGGDFSQIQEAVKTIFTLQ